MEPRAGKDSEASDVCPADVDGLRKRIVERCARQVEQVMQSHKCRFETEVIIFQGRINTRLHIVLEQ